VSQAADPLFVPPAAVTGFVGRQTELSDLRRRLGEHRLVTLVGPGGVGKTRLALQAATTLQRAFAMGAGFIDMTPVAEQSGASERSRLLNAIAEAASPALVLGSGGEDQVIHHLRRGRCLLVLDGWEDTGGPAVAGVTELLRRCPELVVLATARHRLGIDGESLVVVRPLQLPQFDVAEASLAAVRTVDSLALFEERARRARHHFAISPSNVQDVARLVERVDGLPLGIELVAARIRAMTPRQVLERLDDRYGLVASTSPDVPERHRTLSRLLESSYEVCSPRERVLWERMTVFAGTFDLEDVEAVCADDGAGATLPDPDDARSRDWDADRRIRVVEVPDLVTELVDRSVLTVETIGGGTSFRLLSTLRVFGQGRLRESGEQPDLLTRHAEWFLWLARRSAATWTASSQHELLERLRAGWSNLQAAYQHHLAAGRPERALELATHLRPFWLVRGRETEGRDWLQRAAAAGVEDSETLRAGLLCDAYLAAMSDRIAEATDIVRRVEDLSSPASTRTQGLQHLVTAITALFSGQAERAEGAVAAASALGQEAAGTIYAEARFVEGVLALVLGKDTAAVRAMCADMAELPEDRTGAWGRGWFVWLTALADQQASDLTGAQSGAADAFATAADLGDHQLSAWSLYLLAVISERKRDITRARLIAGFLDSNGRPPLLSAMTAAMPTLQLSAAASIGYEFSLGRGLSLRELRARLAPTDPTAQADDVLTPREVEVAILLGQGLSNSEIAERLVISKRTAEGHVQRVFTKLGLERNQLAAWAAARH
jgi:predicted ATPase/DNA-binding CsgD family transcriptional regulator